MRLQCRRMPWRINQSDKRVCPEGARCPHHGEPWSINMPSDSASLKSFFQLLPHRFALCTAIRGECEQIAAVIVEHGKRPHRLWPAAWPFEIHLP